MPPCRPMSRSERERRFGVSSKAQKDPPFHSSLRIRKMQGHPGIREGHVTLQVVFTFHIEPDPDTGELIYVFRNIGTHEIYRRP